MKISSEAMAIIEAIAKHKGISNTEALDYITQVIKNIYVTPTIFGIEVEEVGNPKLAERSGYNG